MKKLLFLSLLCSVALAGEKGNGGDAVVCRNPDGSIRSAELLDFYEGRVMRKLPFVDNQAMADVEYFTQFATKLSTLESPFMKFNTEEAIELMQNIREYRFNGTHSSPDILFTDEELRDIPDSDELVIKRGCKVEQVAIWINQKYPEDPRYILSRELVLALPEKDLRGLVVHELLYKYLLQRHSWVGCTINDSVSVRYLNQKFHATKIEGYTFPEFFDYLYATCAGQQTIYFEGITRLAIWRGYGEEERFFVVTPKRNDVDPNSGENPFKPINGLRMNNLGKLDYAASMKNFSLGVTANLRKETEDNFPGSIEFFRDGESDPIHGFEISKSEVMTLGAGKYSAIISLPATRKSVAGEFELQYPTMTSAEVLSFALTTTRKAQVIKKRFEISVSPDFEITLKEL